MRSPSLILATRVIAAFVAALAVAQAQPPQTNVTLLASFGASRVEPLWPGAGFMAEGPDGSLYSTSPSGGANGIGTVFKVGLDGKVSVLFDFDNIHGRSPAGGLTRGKDGNFYGTTYSGGSNKVGTVFRISPTGGTPDILWNFKNGGLPRLPPGKKHSEQELLDAAGSYPNTPPVQATDGNFYGVTSYANNQKYGVLYRISSGGFRGLYFFDGTNGCHPSTLVAGADGNLYGTTMAGKLTNNNLGTIFKASTSGGVSTLHEFERATGIGPTSLLYGSDGNLYGTTYGGGTGPGGGDGVVFKVHLAGNGAYEVLRKFKGTNDGSAPYAGLAEGPDGFLYGAARYGGGRSGVLYAIGKDGDGFRPLHHFVMYKTGHSPMGTLLLHSNTNLYGTAYQGGKYANGGVYCFSFPPCSPPGRPVQPEFTGGGKAHEDASIVVRTNVTISHPTIASDHREGITIRVNCTNDPHIVQFISRYYVWTNGVPDNGFYPVLDHYKKTNWWPYTTSTNNPQWRTDSLGKTNSLGKRSPYFETGGSAHLDCNSLTIFDEPRLAPDPRYKFRQVTAKVFVICNGKVINELTWKREVRAGGKPTYTVFPPTPPAPIEHAKFRNVSDRDGCTPWP